MNRFLFIALAAVLSVSAPLGVRADEIATTSPGTITDPIEIPVEPIVESTTSAEPMMESGTSTEPIDAPAPAISIRLSIESHSETLFDGPLTVTACPRSPGDATESISGYCALEQSGVATRWSWYGNDAFIDSIGGVANDHAASAYWNWFSDLSFGATALNAHELHEGESLLLTIERFPLRVSLSPDTLVANSTTTVSVLQFGFDTSFNPVWEPAPGSIVLINEESHQADVAGTFAYVPPVAGELTIAATKEGYLSADPVTTHVENAALPAPDTDNGSGSTAPPQPEEDPVASALEFLLHYQRTDGSFPNPLLTDWAAIALKSTGAPTKSLKKYLTAASDPLETATDFERRAMALMSLGIDPQEMIEEITDRFDGTQIGDPSLVNDDIFGLIALSHAGYTDADEITKEVTSFVLGRQKSNGSWESADLTAAAIQALAPLDALPGVSSAVSKARDYLASNQRQDGCFGNSFTTSWGIMAIVALGDSPDGWRSASGISPLACLRSLQAADGGFEEGADGNTRAWATAYAIPALEEDTWNKLLGQYQRSIPPKVEDDEAHLVAALPLESERATTTVEVFPEAPLPMLPIAVTEPAISRTSEQVVPGPPARTLAAAAVLALPEAVPERSASIWSFFADIAAFFLSGIYNLLSKTD